MTAWRTSFGPTALFGSYVEAVYSDAERDEIYNLLETSNILDEDSRKLHIRAVRDLKRY
jgi:hypothetical protein